jgi:hypothetical protein
MQVIQAGVHKMLYLELDSDVIRDIAGQLSLELRVKDTKRHLTIDLTATGRQAPLLLFDASDPGNLGWFSRCQFYVDGLSGAVLQTPISIANQRDSRGHAQPNGLRIQICKELPASFRMPGRQPVNEQVVYGVLFNLLHALLNTGVAVCGGAAIKTLAGRGENASLRG